MDFYLIYDICINNVFNTVLQIHIQLNKILIIEPSVVPTDRKS